MRELGERRLLDNTLIVVTSDHGELFGENGLMGHASSLYAPVLHVPLLMLWPGRFPEGVVLDQPVGLRHLAATVLDLAGIEKHPLPGHSLAPLWNGAGGVPEILRQPVFSSLEQGIRVEPHWRNADGPLHSLITGTSHYIRNSDGSEELFELIADPAETTNLAASSDTAPFRIALDRFLRDGSGRP
jgi:arylsulfatase A-like enzyme